MTENSSNPALVLATLFFLAIARDLGIANAATGEHSGEVRLELVHRHDPRLAGKMTQLERVRDLFQRDLHRYRMISRRHNSKRNINNRRSDLEEKGSVQLPLYSGADYGNGQYFVNVKVGTPGQNFMLIADTGSELTWVNCRYGCRQNCRTHKGRVNNRRVFHADRSSSFRTVPCLSQMCKVELMNLFSLARCPTPLTPCAYDYSYSDGSTASGLFANETISLGLTNGRKKRLHNALIGCTESATSSSFTGADGVLGLGYGKHSFTYSAAGIFGGRFSYCLVDHLSHKNISNYLTFGRPRKPTSLLGNLRRTQLLVGGMVSPFYGVSVLGLSVGNVMLKIPPEVWQINNGGGTILDSGTSLTSLATPAYNPVMNALTPSLLGFSRVSVKPFEFCFNSTGFDDSTVPRLRFHFADGARFEPPVKSYVIDVARQIKCIGLMNVTWPGISVIGNIMQQNHFWEFNLVKRTVGFAPSTCII